MTETKRVLRRREFMIQSGLLTGSLMAGMSAALRHGVAAEGPPGDEKIHWTQNPATHLFAAVQCGGAPLVRLDAPGLLDGFCRFAEESPDKNVWLNPKQPTATLGSLRLELRHELRRSGGHHGEDCLEATLTIGNSTDKPQQVATGFATSAQPSPRVEEQHIYVPLNAAGLFGDGRFAPLGVKNFLKDCNQKVGAGDFQCHYLEPMASEPSERETRAPLLAPVVDIHHPQASWHVALFTPSDQPMRFSTFGVSNQRLAWQAGRCVTVPASGTISQRCWLMPHRGDASVAWKAFHRFAHREDHPPIGWLRDFRVLYYDFLSSAEGENGHRGDGYDADLPHFRDFRVGMAVQHGWYPTLGDYIHPDRKTWKAMRRGKQAPTEMSFDIMRARINATRAAGARAAVYFHASCFDDATPLFQKLRDGVGVDAQGRMTPYPWKGPDTDPAGNCWRFSMASPVWREHLLQQAQWIMEVLNPDALVVDETFMGLSYDHHPDHAGPNSPGAIDFYRRLRSLVRSFGRDKAVMTSDCSMSGFVLWADGECGDHNYPGLAGHPLYTQEPVRYLAALGDKPWRPCAWHFQSMWDTQMKLARQVGAGVGLGNGWIEFTGLQRLPPAVRAKMVGDIATLF